MYMHMHGTPTPKIYPFIEFTQKYRTRDMYTYVHLCIYIYIYIDIYVSMYLCIYVSMYICIYVCMYVCMYVIKKTSETGRI